MWRQNGTATAADMGFVFVTAFEQTILQQKGSTVCQPVRLSPKKKTKSEWCVFSFPGNSDRDKSDREQKWPICCCHNIHQHLQRISFHFSKTNATPDFSSFDRLPRQTVDGPCRTHLTFVTDHVPQPLVIYVPDKYVRVDF